MADNDIVVRKAGIVLWSFQGHVAFLTVDHAPVQSMATTVSGYAGKLKQSEMLNIVFN